MRKIAIFYALQGGKIAIFYSFFVKNCEKGGLKYNKI